MSVTESRFRQIQRHIDEMGWVFDPHSQAFRWPGPVGLGCAPMEPELFYWGALSSAMTREELEDYMTKKTAEYLASAWNPATEPRRAELRWRLTDDQPPA